MRAVTRFGGATVWGEIDGYKQQITACSVKGDLKKAEIVGRT